MLLIPYRQTDDGPDLDERTVFVTVCKSCGWEDEEAHEDQCDCTTEKCPECGSEYLTDLEMMQEFYR